MITLRNALFAGTALLGLAAIPEANATPMTQTIYVDDVAGTATGRTDLSQAAFTGSINQFNASAIAAANPGNTVTLNDVVLTYNPVAQTLGTLTNTSSTTQNFTFELFLQTYLDTAGTLTAAQQIVQNNFGFGTNGQTKLDFGTSSYSLAANGGSDTYPKGSTAPVVVNGNYSTTLTDNTSLNAFTGTGNFGLNLSTLSGQAVVGGGGNVTSALNTFAGAGFTVTYDYTLTPTSTPVPEPASLAILGAGVLGLGLVRRRRA